MKDDSTICSQEKEKGVRSSRNASSGTQGSVWQLGESSACCTTACSQPPAPLPHPTYSDSAPSILTGPLATVGPGSILWQSPPWFDAISSTQQGGTISTDTFHHETYCSQTFLLHFSFLKQEANVCLGESSSTETDKSSLKRSPPAHCCSRSTQHRQLSGDREKLQENKGSKAPSSGTGALLPLTRKLADIGLHRKQKVNTSECLFIISPE